MCCWNAGIYFLLLHTQVDLFGSTFYFLEEDIFKTTSTFYKSKILGKYMYLYFLQSNKVIYFWQYWLLVASGGMHS